MLFDQFVLYVFGHFHTTVLETCVYNLVIFKYISGRFDLTMTTMISLGSGNRKHVWIVEDGFYILSIYIS